MADDTTSTFLQKRLTELESENASLKAENKDRRLKVKKAETELETLRGQVGTLTTERDTLDAKAKAGPTELQAKVDQLEGTLRSRDHRDAFAGVKEFEVPGQDGKAKKYTLADGVKIDALWQLTGYKAEGETPAAEAVAKRLGEALQAHPFLFAEAAAADAATRPITVQAREGGPGAGKGNDSATNAAAMGGRAASTAPTIPGRF